MTADEKYNSENYIRTRSKLSFLASFVKINSEAKNIIARTVLRQKERKMEFKDEQGI
jgi:hypothetical protein